ncbi:acetylserotonin O-methyltransferase-like [Paramuricea clavata]|uniref:Acetylserotonin O-methyltransferase-like n=1 Tax=Paramuricea clavata TaxID=317549 RepID=A0A6S7IHZ2_PARCT|nr:acetylserotonin O-methyltransferase-like [Paramuricea clavata]
MASKIVSACSNYHVLNLIGGYRASYGLFAALNHGLFEYLEKKDGGRTAQQTAKDLTLDETATTVLLDNCTSVDLLVKEIPGGKMDNALYSNSEQTKRYLLPKSPESIYGYAMLEARTLSKLVANFEHTVKEGKSQWERTFGTTSEETFANLYENRESLIEFEEGMGSRMKMSMSSVLGAFDLSEFSHLCDLGGAGGALSYAAVKAYPKMKSTVFDLPAVVNVADHFRPSVEECPNRDNVSIVAGDFFKDDLPPADLYSLVTILHDWDEDSIDLLLNKIYTSLPSGGGILIGEIILDDDKCGPWQANDRLTTKQSGNKRWHSTETTLIRTTDFIVNAMDKRKITAIVLLDMSKAFDSINHGILLKKLQDVGVSRSVLQWFDSYLSNRSERKLRPELAIGNPEIHGFGDDGDKAYGSVIFLRWKLSDGTFLCRPLMVKAFVALLKKSVPILELMGCLTLVRLYRTCKEALSLSEIDNCKTVLWLDSQTVLTWIKSSPRKFKPFVSARVAEIQESVDVGTSKYIKLKKIPQMP